MKELSVEEKAKAYDEALERERNLHKDAVEMENNMTTKICEIIFPELKESDDERIRKKLLSSFKSIMADADEDELWYGLPYNDIIAWLKKQGNNINCIYDKEMSELLHIVICRYINDPDISYPERENVSKKILPYVELLEKQGEQKPAWSKEDEEIVEALNDYVKNLNILFSEIKIGDKDILSKEFREKVQSWLKTLKPQPKQYWSEEDKKALKVVTDIFEQYGVHLLNYPAFIHWLKTLPNRITFNPYWKPTKEQLKQLGKYCPDNTALTTLYEYLKQL